MVSLTLPQAVAWPNDRAPFVLERPGTIAQIEGSESRIVLDFTSKVAMMSEAGALGMALHPQFGDGVGSSPFVYVWYNATSSPSNRQRLSRFTWRSDVRAFDPASELVMVEVAEEKPEHNGGRVRFGPDGFLYFGNGDDIDDANHQTLERSLFAGIFRIDVDARGGAISHPPPRQPAEGAVAGYFIPNDNAFVGRPNVMEEYFALGLRNPFGFSFDRRTGALWAADVGDSWREEVNEIVPGGNYGWPRREGELVLDPAPLPLGTERGPLYSYSHAEMGDLAAILGGFVYRGTDLPELDGKYVYSDWPSGRVWALDTTSAVRTTLVEHTARVPMSIEEDPRGEILVLHPEGIVKLTRDTTLEEVPKRLSETLVFDDVAGLVPAKAFVPYEIQSPLWSDGAAKRRWISVPEGARVELTGEGELTFPVGTIFVKHFELPEAVAPLSRTRRLETRVLVVGEDTTYGLTYRWDADGSDAELVREPAGERIETDGEPLTWQYPSFGQCWSCHRAENRVLGFTARQVNRQVEGRSQLEALVARGVLDPAALAAWPEALPSPVDAGASVEERALAYLAANCSGCHHAGASFMGGGETWNGSYGVTLEERGLVNQPHHNWPMANALGLPDAPLIAPGNPEGSILFARIATTNPDLRMPPLGRHAVDPTGMRGVREWIAALAAPVP